MKLTVECPNDILNGFNLEHGKAIFPVIGLADEGQLEAPLVSQEECYHKQAGL